MRGGAGGRAKGRELCPLVKIPPDPAQPPPYLRDKVKIALSNLQGEINAVTKGGGQPQASAPELQNRCGGPAVQQLQAPPLLDAQPQRAQALLAPPPLCDTACPSHHLGQSSRSKPTHLHHQCPSSPSTPLSFSPATPHPVTPVPCPALPVWHRPPSWPRLRGEAPFPPPQSGTHLHNGLKGAKGAVTGAPVVAVAVHTLLQDVLFAGETHLLVGHPPAGRAWLGSARAGSALRLGPPCAWGGDYSHAAEHMDGLRAGSVLS